MLSPSSSSPSTLGRWNIRKRLLYSFFGVLLLFCLVTLLFLAHNVIHPTQHHATMLPTSTRTVTINTAALDASQLSNNQIERLCSKSKPTADSRVSPSLLERPQSSNSSNSVMVASSLISTSIPIPFGTLYTHHTEVGYFPRSDLLAVDTFSQGWNLSRALKSLPPASLPNTVATADSDSLEGELLRVRHRYISTVDTDLFLHIPSYDGLRPLHIAGSIGGVGQERRWRKANTQGAASYARINSAKAKKASQQPSSPKVRGRKRVPISGTSSSRVSSASGPEVITSAAAMTERLRGASNRSSSSTTGCSSVGPVKCCLYDFRIFVFPLPSVFNVGLMPDFQRNVKDDAAFWTGPGHSFPNIWNANSIQMQFVTEIVQGFGLQNHPCRTMDPEEATFIYMPVWGFYLDRFTDSGVPTEEAKVRKQALELISCYLRQKDMECVDRFWQFIDSHIALDWSNRQQLEFVQRKYIDLSPFPAAPSLEYDVTVWGALSSYRSRFLRNDLRDHLVPASRPYGWRSHPWATWIEEPAPFIHLQYETYLISNEYDYMRAKNIQIPVVCPGEAMYTQYLLFNQWKWSQKRLLIQTMQQLEGGEFETEEEVQAARAARKSSSSDHESMDSEEPFELDPLLCGALDHLERLVKANPYPSACVTESSYSIPSLLANADGAAKPLSLTCPPSSTKVTLGIVKRWRSKTTCSYGKMDITDPTAILSPQSPLYPVSPEAEAQFLTGVDNADRGYLELQAEWERMYVRDWLHHYRSDQTALREVIHVYNDGFQFPSNTGQASDRFRDFEYTMLQLVMPKIMPTSENARKRLDATTLDYFKPIPVAVATNSSLNAASTPFRTVKSLLELPSPLSRPIFAFFFGSPEIYKARQTLHSVLVQEKDCVFVNATRRGKTALTDFSKFYLQSTFCFILAGDTPGSKRLYDSILSGCIPVFINDRWGPTFSFLPWHRFSVRYSEARLQSGIFNGADLMRVLRSFSQLEILEMQRQLYFVRSFFMYPLDSYQHPVRALMKLQDSHPENVLMDRAGEISSLSEKITMLMKKGDLVAAENLKGVQERLKQLHAQQTSIHLQQSKQQKHLQHFNMPTSPMSPPQQEQPQQLQQQNAPPGMPPNQFGPPMPANMKPNPFAPRFMQPFAQNKNFPFAGQQHGVSSSEEESKPAGPLVDIAAEMDPDFKKAIREKWGDKHDFRPRAWDAFEGLMLEFERRVEYAEQNRFQAIPVFSA